MGEVTVSDVETIRRGTFLIQANSSAQGSSYLDETSVIGLQMYLASKHAMFLMAAS